MTNTKVKFVIVVESSNSTLRDNEIRTVSTDLYYSYFLCFFHAQVFFPFFFFFSSVFSIAHTHEVPSLSVSKCVCF